MKFVFALLLTLFTASVALATTPDISGDWSGTWTGNTTGKFTMTIKKDASGKPVGKVDSQQDGGDSMSWDIKSVDIADSKIKIVFGDNNADIIMNLTLSGNDMAGTYAVKGVNGGGELDSGSIKITKK